MCAQPTRRQFIQAVGIAMVSLVLGRCESEPEVLPTPTATSLPPSPIPPTPQPTTCEIARVHLRQCWFDFDWLAQRVQDFQHDFDVCDRARDQLKATHQAALDELVAVGELRQSVADQLQVAFDAAADHVHRLHIPITCYIMAMPHYRRTCSEQLVRQAQMLERLAEQSTINEDTMNRALAAIERDITFLNPYQKTIQLTDDSFHVREWKSLPEYRELDIAITPAAAEAARYLVQLLVEGP